MPKLLTVPISEVRDNPVSLRDVNREREDYLGMVQSMRIGGFTGAITVRKKQDPDTEEVFYEIVDGLHRKAAAQDAGLTEINVQVIELPDDEVILTQIRLNSHKVETAPMEYTKALLDVLGLHNLMTEAQLASELGRTTQWIAQRLSLNKIKDKEIISAINEGKVTLSNAYALAKLATFGDQYVRDYFEDAMTMAPVEFSAKAAGRVKELKSNARKGATGGEVEWHAVAHMRKIGEFNAEIGQSTHAAVILKQAKAKTPMDGFRLAILWGVHLDPVSEQIQREEHEAKIAEKTAAKLRKEKEKAVSDYAARQKQADAIKTDAATARTELGNKAADAAIETAQQRTEKMKEAAAARKAKATREAETAPAPTPK